MVGQQRSKQFVPGEGHHALQPVVILSTIVFQKQRWTLNRNFRHTKAGMIVLTTDAS